ncbi:MAG: family 43 glycosylhydrolase [Asticcacaulis sp.]|nr:family 43 glycosylhydrolase [Asticcacaulis sp.]
MPISQRFNADPSPHFFAGRYYVYATDDASNSGKYWDSTTWRLYSSPDLRSWTDAGIPLGVDVFKWARPDAKAWAPEAAYRNGKYYFYAPVGGDKIGVAVSNRPDGGFVDARSDALVDNARDANAGGEAPFLHEHNGKYYFTFSTGWPGQIVYATSDSPLGPFTYGGVIIDYLTISTNHQAIIERDGKSYLFYHDNLLPGGGSFRRSIAVAPLEYDAQGGIRALAR